MPICSAGSPSSIAVRLGLHGTSEAEGNDLICGHIESQVTPAEAVNLLCASDASILIRLCQNTTEALLRIDLHIQH